MSLLQWVVRKLKDSQEDKETSLSTSQEPTEETKLIEETKGNETKAFRTNI